MRAYAWDGYGFEVVEHEVPGEGWGPALLRLIDASIAKMNDPENPEMNLIQNPTFRVTDGVDVMAGQYGREEARIYVSSSPAKAKALAEKELSEYLNWKS